VYSLCSHSCLCLPKLSALNHSMAQVFARPVRERRTRKGLMGRVIANSLLFLFSLLAARASQRQRVLGILREVKNKVRLTIAQRIRHSGEYALSESDLFSHCSHATIPCQFELMAI
jgi:hypothetical protein